MTDIPCRLPLRYARVRESRRAVTVTLYSPKPTGPCIQIVARACATVRLPHALAGRRLRDGAPPAGRRDPGARPFRGCRRIPVRS
ncbi:MAG: hypothetical protein E6G10_07600 [Actinobacteria bacterium]|nr:MAG: hypothetical protein E6G10_07600 [Actinomycetota bacterium]